MTPDIQSLRDKAKAAVEARKNYDKTDYSLNNEFFEWQKVKELFSISATPERILQYRDEVLEEAVAVLKEAFWNNHRREDIVKILRSLKSKEPSP